MKALIKQKRRYNLIFIDGSHEYSVVLNDCKYSDKLLKKRGIVVLDDVLHKGVSKAIQKYYSKNKNYRQVQLNEKTLEIDKFVSLSKKKSWRNPYTMYAYQKIN